MAVDPKELHRDFVVETTELLAMAEDLMLKLENSTDLDPVHALFRAFHTIKGTSAFLGFKNLSDASHAVEAILDGFRARRFAVTRPVIDLLLLYIDAVRAFLQLLQLSGVERALKQDFTRLTEKLRKTLDRLEAGDAKATESRVIPAVQGEKSATPPAPAASAQPPAPVAKAVKLDKSARPAPAAAADLPPPPDDIARLLSEAPQAMVTWALPWEKAGAPAPASPPAPAAPPAATAHNVPVAGGKSNPDAAPRIAPAREIPTGATPTHAHPAPASPARGGETGRHPVSTDTTTFGLALEKRDQETRITAAGPAVAGGGADPRRETHVIERTFLPSQKGATKLIPMHRSRDGRKSGDTALIGARPTLRVDASQIDELINLVGEMVLSRNRLVEASGLSMKKSFNRSTRKTERADPVLLPELVEALDKSTTAVHKAVMRLRMVSLEPFFQRFPRLVHDLSGQLNKMIRLEIAGEATELDKSVVEAISDPLVHLVRNAAFHGIESAEERVKAGKPRAGTIFLSARPEGESVAITIEDDGRGFNVQRIAEKAVATGVISAEQLQRMQPHEIIELVFLPGFTTEDTVGAISGRGVGLDVVREYINQIGGSVSLSTELGHGTKITLNLPMTLAILRALLVEVNGMTFAIPLSAVRKTRRLKPGDARQLHGQWILTDLHTGADHPAPHPSAAANPPMPTMPPAPHLHTHAPAASPEMTADLMIPFSWADEGMGFAHGISTATARSRPPTRPVGEASYAVVIGMGGRMVAWGVDKLIGQEDIVAKSLPPILGPVPGLAGATISSDGATILIADVSGFTTQVES